MFQTHDDDQFISAMSNSIIDQFNTECNEYLNTELNIHLLSSSSTDKTAISEYYLNEYQRCIDEQKQFVNYMNEQMTSLESLKAYDAALDKFMERLKSIHDYEFKQNELFEQILQELTKTVKEKIEINENESGRLFFTLEFIE